VNIWKKVKNKTKEVHELKRFFYLWMYGTTDSSIMHGIVPEKYLHKKL
jgi:hypothetical protein